MIYKCCLTFFHPPSQQLFYSLRVIVSAQVVCLCACFDSVHVCVHLCLSLVLNVHSLVCVGETECVWEREREREREKERERERERERPRVSVRFKCHPWHLKQIGVYRVFNVSQPEPNTIHSRLSDSLVLSRSSFLLLSSHTQFLFTTRQQYHILNYIRLTSLSRCRKCIKDKCNRKRL